jgi:hypothetical protein
MLNFVYLRSSRLHFLHFGLDSCIVNKGENLSMVWATEFIYKVFRWFRAISGLCVSPVWPVEVTGLTGQSARPIHMLRIGLTGGGDRSDRSELSWCSYSVFIKWFACIRPGGVPLVHGELACVQGELFVVFEHWFGGLCCLLENCFVSDVSSRCPCLRGPRLVFFKWSCSLPFFGFRSLVWVSFYSFLFFFYSLGLLYVCVVNALIKGEIEDHVWFEDRCMFASWCDEWLTMLCGPIFGWVLQVQVAAWLALVQAKNKCE